MVESDLSQAEAERLIAMEKVKVDDTDYHYPGMGGSVTMPLRSRDRREHFLLDLHKGRINLAKGKYQTRGRKIVVLMRLDFGGAPHCNPDGEEIGCPHLHVYREGYGDKWAISLPADHFGHVEDRWQTLQDFLSYCKIVEPPNIQPGLFHDAGSTKISG